MKKKRDKKYVPRETINPLEYLARQSTAKIEQSQAQELDIVFLGALDGMTGTRANEEMWSNLAVALNTSLLLCQSGINPEMTRTVDAALDGLVKVKQRAVNGHGWQLGNHYDVIRAGCEVHHKQMHNLPKRILRKTLQEVMRRTGNHQEAARLAA